MTDVSLFRIHIVYTYYFVECVTHYNNLSYLNVYKDQTSTKCCRVQEKTSRADFHQHFKGIIYISQPKIRNWAIKKKNVNFCKDSDRKLEQMPSLSWMLMLVELDIGSIYPNPVLGFGKFWSIPNKIGTHFRMGFDNWMSLINHLSNAYVSSDGQP